MLLPPEHARPGKGAGRTIRAVAAAAVLGIVAAGGSVPAGAAPHAANRPAPAPAPAATSLAQMESDLADLINFERWARGGQTIPFHTGLADQARTWSAFMAYFGELFHHGDLASQADQIWPGWTGAAENVGRGTDIYAIHRAFMASAPHRSNVLGDWRTVGVGLHESGGQLWATVRFLR